MKNKIFSEKCKFSKLGFFLFFTVFILFNFPVLWVKAQIQEPNLAISKSVKNLTDNTDWQDVVTADPGEVVSFRIEITSNGKDRATNVWLKDKLPLGIYYEGDLKADGISSTWDILEGFNLGYLDPGQSRVFIYTVKVGPEKDFSPGVTTNLVNTARVWAYQVSTKEDSATVNVYRSPLTTRTFSVNKLVKNLSSNTDWQDSVMVSPGDKISFSIKIQATGNAPAKGIIVKDSLPNRIVSQGNLKIDEVSVSGDILAGVNIGELSPGQSKTITFDGVVVSKENFNYGTTSLINSVLVYNNEKALTDSAEIIVTKKEVAGAATAVPTGFTNNKFLDYLLLPLGLASILFLIFKEYLVLVNNYLEGRKEKVVGLRSEKNLQKKINRIKIQEYFSKKN